MGYYLARFAAALLFALLTLPCFADQRVLIIGVDGLGGQYLPNANTPVMDTLATEGAISYEFLNEAGLIEDPPGPYAASGVNWSTILTGVSAATHGVSDNSFIGNQFDSFPSFFTHLNNHDPSLNTMSVVTWDPINTQIVANGTADIELQPLGSSGAAQDAEGRIFVAQALANDDPHAIFWHIDQVDYAGHDFRWGSPQYYAAINTVDSLIGDAVNALKSRPGYINGTEEWLVMITSDHGGLQNSHTASQGPIAWEVPFIIWGDGVSAGNTIQPGTLRDVASTALYHMGVDVNSLSLEGGIVEIDLSTLNGIVGDVNQDGIVAGNGLGPIETDDVTAFIAGWGTTGLITNFDRYTHGDLNLDGTTDLADLFILNQADPTLGAAAGSILSRGVPEPRSAILVGMTCVVSVLLYRWIRQVPVSHSSVLPINR